MSEGRERRLKGRDWERSTDELKRTNVGMEVEGKRKGKRGKGKKDEGRWRAIGRE